MALGEKTLAASGTLSGALGFLGGYQVCHSICIALISILAAVGITLNSFPFLFLTKVAVPIWVIAAALLVVTLIVYLRKHCFSRNLLIINSGLIVAGVPFEALQAYRVLFWVAGGLIVIAGVMLFIHKKFRRN